MPEIIVFSDYVCPFCCLAEATLSRLRREDRVEVAYRAFELRPAPLPLLDPGDEGLRRAWERVVEPLARELGVVMRLPRVQPRTRKAHEAVAFARDHGRFPAMHEALFRAFFAEGEDIGRIDVLVRLGGSVGLEPTALKVALDIDQYTERVLAEEIEAQERGVAGVPSFLIGEELRVGLQSYEALRALVVDATDEATP